jgi:hypothetical protein
MQITLNIDEVTSNDLKREFHTENIEKAVQNLIDQFRFRSENRIASEIETALFEVKNGKTEPIEELLNEL